MEGHASFFLYISFTFCVYRGSCIDRSRILAVNSGFVVVKKAMEDSEYPKLKQLLFFTRNILRSFPYKLYFILAGFLLRLVLSFLCFVV